MTEWIAMRQEVELLTYKNNKQNEWMVNSGQGLRRVANGGKYMEVDDALRWSRRPSSGWVWPARDPWMVALLVAAHIQKANCYVTARGPSWVLKRRKRAKNMSVWLPLSVFHFLVSQSPLREGGRIRESSPGNSHEEALHLDLIAAFETL